MIRSIFNRRQKYTDFIKNGICNHAKAGLYLWFLYCALLAFTSNTFAATEKQSVLILHQQSSGFSQQLIGLLENDITARGFKVEKRLLKDKSPDQMTLEPHDLIISMGSRTTKLMLDNSMHKPMLSLLIPENLALALEYHYPDNKMWGSLLIDHPVERHFYLISSLLGKNAKVSMALGPLTQSLQATYTAAARTADHQLFTHSVDNPDQLATKLLQISQQSDVLLTTPDPELYNKNTIRSILLSSYRYKLPIIGFSQAYVHAGAIAAIYSQPQQISRQATDIIEQTLKRRQRLQKRYQPDDFSVSLNEQVARSLGIKLPEASSVIQQIKQLETQP